MDLNQIVRLPEATGMTAEQILAYGDESVVVGGSDELWSYSGVAINFGDAAAEGLLQAIQGSGLIGAAQVYLVKGMQLSLPTVQDKLTAIGLEAPALAAVCNALKEIGITHGTRWQLWGIERPTLEQLDIALAPITDQQKIAALINEFILPYVSRPDSTLSGILAVIADATK